MAIGLPGHTTLYCEEAGEIRGFFTLREEHGIPYVLHFCGRPEMGWRLVKALKSILAQTGAQQAIINVPTAKTKLLRATMRALHAVPYAEQDGHTFLMMEVGHG